MTGPAWHPRTGTHVVGPAKCPCDYGPCSHCKDGNHSACLWVRDPAEAARMDARPPYVFLLDRRGFVPIFPTSRGEVARVYLDRAGAHTWRCPCYLDGHGKLAAAEGMLDLFGDTTT